MRDADMREFGATLRSTLEIYNRPLTEGALGMWWEILHPYPWAQVRIALQQHVRSGQFAPTPADILALLPRQVQRPEPDAAEVIARAAPNREAALSALAQLKAMLGRMRG